MFRYIVTKVMCEDLLFEEKSFSVCLRQELFGEELVLVESWEMEPFLDELRTKL